MSRFNVHRQVGVALLEVMIAVLVVSFGLLGVAALQVAGLKSNQTSQLRSTVVAQANDMADRMRANMMAVRTGKYDAVTNSVPTKPPCASPFTTAGGCNPTDMATYDAFAWQAANRSLLPGGGGTVTKGRIKNPGNCADDSVDPSGDFSIKVLWTEKCVPGEGSCTSGNVSRCFRTQFQP